MANKSFKRQIPISSLFKGTRAWYDKNGSKGFTILTTDLCDLLAQYDPDWMGEEGWADALDQFVYVEFLVMDENNNVRQVLPFSSIKDMGGYGQLSISLGIRSCEDDFCMELLVSDIMVRYCIADDLTDDLWSLVVKETAILERLFILNGKGENAFWTKLLDMNKHLKVVSEKPWVRVFLGDEFLMAYEYDPDIPLPQAQTNDMMQVIHHGQKKKFFVEERTFCYEHPFSQLSEIRIGLYQT